MISCWTCEKLSVNFLSIIILLPYLLFSMTSLCTEAILRFNPIEYNIMEGNGTLMVCVEILTEAEGSQYSISVLLQTFDGVKTSKHSSN